VKWHTFATARTVEGAAILPAFLPPKEVTPVVEKISPEAHAEYQRIHATEEFHELKGSYLRFVVPLTIAFMAWYLLYVFMSNWAGGFMDTKVVGNINVALVFGLLQFLTTFGIAIWYARFAARRMDPIADRLRDQYEREIER
jgi:uncharacterized membrane protein (DUF485 family)